MALYRYVKTYPKPKMKRSVKISLFLMGMGVFLLLWVSWPILSFHLLSAPFFTSIVSPLGTTRIVQASAEPTPLPDYTNPNIWFPLKPQLTVVSNIKKYTLSIPKLGISNATVEVGGDDLNRALIHYGGTALPGDIGNAAIFGHSVLPQFFNPLNYKTIFSKLPDLKEGDDIFLKVDEITYRYKIKQMTVRPPSDLSMLDQPTDDAYITLITCVPPGTYWQRLHVRAQIVRPG
jgi:sortase A